jgi:hypothetical protein
MREPSRREPFDLAALRSSLPADRGSAGAWVRRLLVFVATSVIALAALIALVLAVVGMPDRTLGR